jgi:hypothetical protein
MGVTALLAEFESPFLGVGKKDHGSSVSFWSGPRPALFMILMI